MTADRWAAFCEFVSLLASVVCILVVLGIAGAVLFAAVVP